MCSSDLSDAGNIISQSGTTITLGASGDTINLAGGATQSGFGRNGSVNWQTTPKTATFTAVNGEGYFANTSGGAFTVNLPAGSAGAIISIADYTRTFATNNLTVVANGSEKIGGVAQTLPLNINGQALTLIYVDGTEGWINVQNAEDTETGLIPAFVAASGGNSCATSGDFKYHIFTGPGTFTVSNAGNANGSNSVSYLVLAGGGGGGGNSSTPNDAGTSGAGAGGYREGLGLNDSYTGSPLRATTGVPVATGPYAVAVGGGGAGTGSNAAGSKGNNSSFSTITSAGGGGGGGYQAPEGQACRPVAVLQGGSGGGGGTYQNSPGQTGSGTGNQPPVSPPQGNDGGNGTGGRGGAGGGGAGAVGTNGSNSNAGAGGNGVASEITASSVTRGGGGGGGNPSTSANGGTGGGGNASNTPGGSCAGTVNTGGGGAGNGKTPNATATGSAGGSGIVVIRYKFQ